jgi:hypothetical protein
MPEIYLRIKQGMRKAHPSWAPERVKKVSAMIYNKLAKKKGLQTVGRGRP